jgi:hypothetical protein
VQETAIAAGEADGTMPVVLSGWDVAGWVELGTVGASGGLAGLAVVERERASAGAVGLRCCPAVSSSALGPAVVARSVGLQRLFCVRAASPSESSSPSSSLFSSSEIIFLDFLCFFCVLEPVPLDRERFLPKSERRRQGAGASASPRSI